MKIKKNLLWGLIISGIIFILCLVAGIANLMLPLPRIWTIPIIMISVGSTIMVGVPLTIFLINKSKEDSEGEEETTQ